MPPQYGIPLFSRAFRWMFGIGLVVFWGSLGFAAADLMVPFVIGVILALIVFVMAGREWLEAVGERAVARREAREPTDQAPAPDVESNYWQQKP